MYKQAAAMVLFSTYWDWEVGQVGSAWWMFCT